MLENQPYDYFEQLYLWSQPEPLTEANRQANLAEDIRVQSLMNRSKPSLWSYVHNGGTHRRASLIERNR